MWLVPHRQTSTDKGTGVSTKRKTPWIWVLACAGAVSACEGTGVEPNLRFGQSGQLVVHVVTPRPHVLPSSYVDGEVQQTLTWRSNGAWQLFESIAYRSLVGSETTVRSPGIPGTFATEYATLVALINGSPSLAQSVGLDLFIDGLDPTLDPDCGPSQSRITLRIQDEIRSQNISWTRCARGPLGSLNPTGSGPGLHASRVINVANYMHDGTLGHTATSAYHGSIPFATLAKGEKPGDLDLASRVFLGGPDPGDAPVDWGDFWRWHSGGTPLPDIDWSTDMVVVAGDGARFEAGTTVEIRRIEPIRDGAIVKLVEFVPGDFCSPAAVVQTPYHLVVAPRTPPGIQFGNPTEERVPCGL